MKKFNILLLMSAFIATFALPALASLPHEHWNCVTHDELHRQFQGTGVTQFQAEEASFRSCATYHYGAHGFCHKPPTCNLTLTATVYFCANTDESGRQFLASSASREEAEAGARAACRSHHGRSSYKCPSAVSCLDPNFEPAPVAPDARRRYDLRGTDVEGQRFIRRFRRFQTTPSGTDLGSDY